MWSRASIRVWVRDLESQDANRTLVELLAPSFGERLSLKRLVANLKEISEPYDYTFQTLTSRELAAKRFHYKNKYPLLGERFGEPLTLYEMLLRKRTFQGGKNN
jgi:3-deoxy-D-manno-octulosonic-acid transferase